MANTDFQLKQALKKLSKIPEKIQDNVMNGALRSGAVIIKDIAKDNIPEDEGNLKKEIKVKKNKKRKNTETTYRIGLTREGYYGFFIHQGTEKIKPVPFMTIGYEQGGEKALDKMKSYLKIRVEKEIKKIKG